MVAARYSEALENDDNITGDGDSESIDAGLGNDTVDAGAGNDTLDGGEGNDVIDAGEGNDDVEGGSGNDSIEAGAGSDTLDGGEGDDIIDAGDGNDDVEGGSGDDNIEAGAGSDSLEGGDGDDSLDGGSGDDLLIGGIGSDTYELSRGDDTIRGFRPDDKIVLSDDLKNSGLTEQDVTITTDEQGIGYLSFSIGSETYTTTVIGISEQSDLEVEEESAYDLVVNGSDGDDISHGNNHMYGPEHVNNTSEGTETWTIGNSNELQLFEPGSKDQAEKINGKGGNDYIFANKGNDYIEGGAGDDTLHGNRGNDEVLGGTGNDQVYGNDDDDTIRGGLGNDTLHGGDGNDRLVADQDNDQLYGNDGGDTLLGGDGNDVLNGGNGDDEMFGEKGNDTFKASPGNDTIKDFYYGKDSLKDSTGYVWDAGSITTNSATHSATINVLDKTLGTVVGTTTVIFKDVDNFNAFLEEINDNPNSGFPPIGASDPKTTLEYLGSDKDFKALGGKEDNLITVDEINEFANYYYNDDDRYFTSNTKSPKPNEATLSNSYSIDGGSGDDTMEGGDKNDYLHGSTGNDELYGGNGKDNLKGGSDNDTLFGGDGDDSLHGWAGEDWLKGDEGNDLLEGQNDKDTLDGGQGDDTLDGGESNDILHGQDGNDSLIGGDGSDRLHGHGGDDTLEGGAGKDLFFASRGNDVIKDFIFEEDSLHDATNFIWDRDTATFDDEKEQVSIDVLKKDGDEYAGTTIINVENYDELIAAINESNQIGFPPSGASDPDTTITFKGEINDSNQFEIDGGDLGNSIDLDNINDFAAYYQKDDDRYINESNTSEKPVSINQTDALTITGGGGEDTIKGGDANDSIHGGQQNDTIEGGEGNDTLRGGNHNDSLIGGEGDDLLRGENAADTLDGGLGNDTLYGAGNNQSGDNNKWADVFIASPGNDEIKDFVFGLHELRDSDSYFWELENTTFDDDNKTATIPILDENGYPAGETIITVENYDELIKAKEDNENAGFPPVHDLDTKLIYKGSEDGADQFEVLGGSEANTINLESINEFAGYYILDDARYEDQSSLRNGKPTTINDDDQLFMDGGSGNDSLTGNNGNDTIHGGDDNDILIGGDGSDSLKGGNGEDRIDGGHGNDTMHGGTGGDVFFASTGTDYIEDFKFTEDKLENSVGVTWDIENATYDDENESVIINTLGSTEEGSGTTTIKVTNYAELIAAKEEEKDIAGFPIVGGDGSGGGDGGGSGGGGSSEDTSGGDLIDAPGSDNSGNGNNNSTNEGNDAEDGTVDGQPINPPNNSDDPTNQLREIFIDPSPSKTSFTKTKLGSGRIFGKNQNDRLHGDNKSDFLNGRGGNDHLYGRKGNDTLIGAQGDDVMQGGVGNDILKGGSGDDVLYGGEGNDTLTGNGGKDVFILSTGRDIITDFNIKKDAIGLVYALDLTFTQIGNDLQIKGNDGVNTLLRNVDKDDFLANFPDNLFDAAAVEVTLI